MTTSPRLTAPQTRFADALRHGTDLLRVLGRSAWPLADLLMRLSLAQAFFVSGVLKAANWETALNLARYEYPVPWMEPETAALVGVTIELGAPVLLALGLATRAAGLALLLLTLVIQHSYVALDGQLFWAWLFGWYLVQGAGPLSLDRMLARGLADSALPLAAPALRAAVWVSSRIGPLYRLALRLWLAAGLGLTGSTLGSATAAWLPLETLPAIGPALGVACTLLLALGLATRPAAAALALAALAAGMTGVPAEFLYWLVLLLLPLLFHGGGPIALDPWIAAMLRRHLPGLEEPDPATLAALPRVAIVGAGFGGLACAAGLRHAPVSVTLIDRQNYHLFQPLLYQVATAGLAPSDIAAPIREVFREQRNARVLLGTVTGIDAGRREVLIGERRLPYDYLVLASGASHSYFGRDDWAPFAPGLKRVEDATAVHGRVLVAFERAEAADDPSEREALMTFLIVGGGPTGVELAGAIAELARFGMAKDFRRIDPARARVVLVQSAPRILPTFTEALSARAAQALENLGVEVVTGSRVTGIDAEGVVVGGRRIAARTVLWAAGVVASPAAHWLGAEADNAGRVLVGPDLRVLGQDAIFAIGDTALTNAWNGQPVPGLAPAAKQGGQYVARVIAARVTGRKAPPGFAYRHQGSLATIGRKAAVADFGRISLSGTLAWWLWGGVHLFFLVGLRNRISVVWDWFWAYLTYRSGTRLITGAEEPATAISEAQPRTLERVRVA
jgi:NADH dehydrogenase FAD-containing subunit/uncharacterized membrane protein YphA (DoxX/SURF4 family)